jgi:glutaredoxin
MESCPYCRKVMKFFEENNIEYNKKDIADEKNLEKLLDLGCKRQVPFLYDPQNDVKMYESDDIIDYAAELKTKSL